MYLLRKMMFQVRKKNQCFFRVPRSERYSKSDGSNIYTHQELEKVKLNKFINNTFKTNLGVKLMLKWDSSKRGIVIGKVR